MRQAQRPQKPKSYIQQRAKTKTKMKDTSATMVSRRMGTPPQEGSQPPPTTRPAWPRGQSPITITTKTSAKLWSHHSWVFGGKQCQNNEMIIPALATFRRKKLRLLWGRRCCPNYIGSILCRTRVGSMRSLVLGALHAYTSDRQLFRYKANTCHYFTARTDRS